MIQMFIVTIYRNKIRPRRGRIICVWIKFSTSIQSIRDYFVAKIKSERKNKFAKKVQWF
jgi:hypothetical protein